VDPRRFHGGVYRAANWIELGLTQGYRRTRDGYSAAAHAPKRVFVRSLCRHPQTQLTQPDQSGPSTHRSLQHHAHRETDAQPAGFL
ncbi:MAG: hypothetical protein ACXW36_11195, partial [Nitrospira sp.]